MIYCEDCKWYLKEQDFQRYRCSRESALIPVTRAVRDLGTWRSNCHLQRDAGFIETYLMRQCGRRGRWFEPKEEK